VTIENPHQHAGGTFQTRLRQDGIFPFPAKFLNLEALDHGEPTMDFHGHPVSQIMCSTVGRVLYRLGNAPIEFIVSQIGLFHVYCLSSTSSKSFRCLCTSIDDARDLIEYMGIIHNVITH